MTQKKLAKAFSVEESLASVTVSSWESLKSPKLPPRTPVPRLRALFRYTSISSEEGRNYFRSMSLTRAKKRNTTASRLSSYSLRNAASGESPEEESIFSRSWLFRDGGLVTFVCAQLPEEVIGEFGDRKTPITRNYRHTLT